MSYAMSTSKSRWKGALLATVAASVLTPLASHAQSMSVSILANPLGGGTSTNKYTGSSSVYIDPYDTDTLYVYATVTGTAAPSASYVDGLEYLYFNVNAASVATGGLGSITAATPSAMFGGGSFNQTSGNTSPGAGAQGGAIATGALTTTSSIVVGSGSNIGSIAKPRSAGDIYWSSTTGSGSNIVVNGNSVSFLVETLTYTPTTSAFTANPSKVGTPQGVTFNVSIPTVSTYGPYTGANYFVGLPSTPAVGTSPGASNTSTGYTASASTIKLTDALPGDVNLDGTVNGVDLGIVASHFNSSVTTGYTGGDLNNDGTINGVDFAQVASNFNSQLGPAPSGGIAGPTAQIGGSAVPEPASLGLLSLAGLGLLRRRRSM